jgi:hypothetical protein
MAEKPAIPEPKRRWWQFRLRTLLIVVVIGSICGWRAKVLSERDARAKWFVDRGFKVYRIGRPVGPMLRFLFWDQQIAMIPPKHLSPDDKHSIAEAMPSDTIITDGPPAPLPVPPKP